MFNIFRKNKDKNEEISSPQVIHKVEYYQLQSSRELLTFNITKERFREIASIFKLELSEEEIDSVRGSLYNDINEKLNSWLNDFIKEEIMKTGNEIIRLFGGLIPSAYNIKKTGIEIYPDLNENCISTIQINATNTADTYEMIFFSGSSIQSVFRKVNANDLVKAFEIAVGVKTLKSIVEKNEEEPNNMEQTQEDSTDITFDELIDIDALAQLPIKEDVLDIKPKKNDSFNTLFLAR